MRLTCRDMRRTSILGRSASGSDVSNVAPSSVGEGELEVGGRLEGAVM